MIDSQVERLTYLHTKAMGLSNVIDLIIQGDLDQEALSDYLAELNYALELCAASGDLDFEVMGNRYIEITNEVIEKNLFKHQSLKLLTDMSKGVNFKEQ